MKKRLLAMLLVLMLVVSLLPVGALAANDTEFHIMDMGAIKALVAEAYDVNVDDITIHGIYVNGVDSSGEPATATGGITEEFITGVGCIGDRGLQGTNGKLARYNAWKVLNDASVIDQYSITSITIYARTGYGYSFPTLNYGENLEPLTVYVSEDDIHVVKIEDSVITEIYLNNASLEPPEPELFDIIYTTGSDAGDVTDMPANVEDVEAGTVQSVSDVTPSRAGYIFDGWTTEDVNVVDGKFTMPEHDVTFTAKWVETKEINIPKASKVIYVKVYVDGTEVNSSELENYIELAFSESSNASTSDSSTGKKITYDATYYNCLDIGVSAKAGYVIEEIDAFTVFGQNGTSGITKTVPGTPEAEYGEYYIDNAFGTGRTNLVEIYVRTQYEVKFYDADGNEIDVADVSGLIADSTDRVSFGNVSDVINPIGETGFYHVNCGCESTDICDHIGYVTIRGSQPAEHLGVVWALNDSITLPELPEGTTGWYLNNTGEPLSGTYEVSSGDADENNVIKFYATSTTVEPETQPVHVVIYKNGNTSEPVADIAIDSLREGDTLDTSKLDISEYYTPDKFATGFAYEGWFNDGAWNKYVNAGCPEGAEGLEEIEINGWTNVIAMVWDQFPVYYNIVDENGKVVEAKIHTDTITARNLDNYTFYDASKTGYTFDGWYEKAEDIGNESKKEGLPLALKKYELYGRYDPIPQHLEIYAAIDKNKDEAVKIYSEMVDYGTPLVEYLESLTLETDVFPGYSPENGKWYKYDSPDWTFGENDTVAGWTNVLLNYVPNEYTIYYYGNGGKTESGAIQSTSTFEYGSTATIKNNPFAYEGYVFEDWALSADGEVVYTGSEEVPFTKEKFPGLLENGKFEFYAVWAEDSKDVTVKFIDENTSEQVGENHTLSVAPDAYNVNSSQLNSEWIPDGYELARVGDFVIEDGVVNVPVRKIAYPIQVSFVDETYAPIGAQQTVNSGESATPPTEDDGRKIVGWIEQRSGEVYTGGFDYASLAELVDKNDAWNDYYKKGYLTFEAVYEPIVRTIHVSFVGPNGEAYGGGDVISTSPDAVYPSVPSPVAPQGKVFAGWKVWLGDEPMYTGEFTYAAMYKLRTSLDSGFAWGEDNWTYITFQAVYNDVTVDPTPAITGFTKTLVTSPYTYRANGYDAPEFYRGDVIVDEGDSVTLIYRITVYGTAGTGYTVADEGAVRLDGDAWSGVLNENGLANILVAKTFSWRSVRNSDTLDNTAYVYMEGSDTPVRSDTERVPVDIDWDYNVPDDDDDDTVYVPNWLNTSDHYAYIVGYEDGTIKPENNITRAEVATIFFRLLTDNARARFWSSENSYTDVAAESWYNNAISTLSRMGIINGYEDGSFRPNAPITRAEFTAIATRFFDYTARYAGAFNDVASGSWYADYVQAAVDMGLVDGYPDGGFHPNSYITRAEAVTIVNRVLNRVPHENHLLSTSVMNTWPDNRRGTWYYADMQEATNSHDYDWIRVSGERVEDWTAKLPERDWAALEQQWSTAYSG